jgi:predicted transcriptional regulator
MNEDEQDLLFQALASQPRREILRFVRAHAGCNVQAVTAQFSMSHVGILKHLGVLEAAGLIVSIKEGRARKLFFNLVPLQIVHEEWSDEYGAYFAQGLVRLKQSTEKWT